MLQQNVANPDYGHTRPASIIVFILRICVRVRVQKY